MGYKYNQYDNLREGNYIMVKGEVAQIVTINAVEMVVKIHGSGKELTVPLVQKPSLN